MKTQYNFKIEEDLKAELEATQQKNHLKENWKLIYDIYKDSTARNSVTDNPAKDNTGAYIYNATDILEVAYRNEIASPTDVSMTKIDRSTYQALANKKATGTPSQYFVQRFIDKITITLYLTPGSSEAGNKLNFYFVKRIQDVGDYTNATDVPYRFAPCMVSGLAFYLAQKYAPQRAQEMKLYYEDELNRALTEDGSSTSTHITPKTYYPEVG